MSGHSVIFCPSSHHYSRRFPSGRFAVDIRFGNNRGMFIANPVKYFSQTVSEVLFFDSAARRIAAFRPVDLTPIIRHVVEFLCDNRDAMKVILKPCQLAFVLVATWVNQRLPRNIRRLSFKIPRLSAWPETLGNVAVLLTDDRRRRRLAVKGKAIGRKALRELMTIVTPGTILRWHRELVANMG